MLQTIWNFIINLPGTITHIVAIMPPEFWGYIGSAIGVSALAQKIKKWASLEKNKGWVTFILTALSSIPAIVSYFMNQAADQPWVIAPHTLTILGGSIAFYNTIGKSIIKFLNDAEEERKKQITASANISIPASPNIFD
jgi:hypothetical protein